MNKVVKFLLCAVVLIGLTIVAAVFWNYSRRPNAEKISKIFPDNSIEVFNNGKKVTVYSLKPDGGNDGSEVFHGYVILSKKEIEGSGRQFLLKHSLLNGTVGAYGAACFNPRHGLQIVDGEKTVDIVICFECGNFITYFNGKEVENSIESIYAEYLYNHSL